MKNLSFTLDHQQPAQLLNMCPTYTPTPTLQKHWGGMTFWIKDETDRMGLGAFKALGGVYAVAQLIMGDNIQQSEITLDSIREKARQLTFVCASAGNHGMAVAAGANLFGATARIHLSDTVPEAFKTRLQSKGAQVIRSGSNYEQSILAAIEDADENGYIHLADGSWPGYTQAPRLVMEGYTVIAEELRGEFELSSDWPTHVFLQAGVGGIAASVTYMIRKNWPVQPQIIVVEPDSAPCLKHSVEAGEIVTVSGPVSNMGRLDCKAPSMLAFEILKSAADHFVVISDKQAQLAADEMTEDGLPTTASGAAGYCAMKHFNLPDKARPLVIVTEEQV